MTTPEIIPEPVLRRHCQRILPHWNGKRLPGPAFFVLVLLNFTRGLEPKSCVLFSLN
jgi:hypothetical protein